ncbi:MAG: methylmalonyl Co-A mutase-associated GTPase MeaB, partial [Gammaproteobacteria bacterium]|nr:methylmalonyl Co-A mutase-associated GTPase MeaB [Gammaproteobacteria bacterium]
GKGIVEAWEAVLRHRKMLDGSGQFTERRAGQAQDWMWLEVKDSLTTALQGDDEVREQIPILETAAREGRVPPTTAAQRLLDIFLKRHN